MAKKEYLIIRDRPGALSPVYWNLIYQTWPRTKKIYDVNIPVCWLIFVSGRQRSIYPKEVWNKNGDYIAQKIIKDDRYFNKIKQKVELGKKRLDKFFLAIKKVNFSKLDNKELINLADKIQSLSLTYESANVLAWFMSADKIQTQAENKIDISKEDFTILATPEEKTEVSKLESDLLKYAKLIKEKKISAEKAAMKLSDNYGWIPFGYDGPVYWDEKHFTKELNKLLKKGKPIITEQIIKNNKSAKDNKKEKIIKNNKLNKDHLTLIDKINIITLWTDERKKYTFKLYYYYNKILKELEKKYKIPLENLKFLFTEELYKLEKLSKKEILKLTNNRRQKLFIVEYNNGKGEIISETKQKEILRELKKQTEISNIKGMVASKGTKNIYQSRVKVVLSPLEGKKIKAGDFLIATMTSPDYILAMKKAAGFITDEGGVTCHAAIVAREMKKPCIIGTKIATQVLKDGDEVEVDAEHGIVKIIKKRKG